MSNQELINYFKKNFVDVFYDPVDRFSSDYDPATDTNPWWRLTECLQSCPYAIPIKTNNGLKVKLYCVLCGHVDIECIRKTRYGDLYTSDIETSCKLCSNCFEQNIIE